MEKDFVRVPMIKFLLLGNSCVGKTSMLLRYVANEFRFSTVTTIGLDFKYKDVVIGEQNIKLQIWDTAGTERYRTIGSSQYRGARAILLVYDVTKSSSFQSVKGWIDDIDRELGTENVCIILIGNKIDLEDQRQVSTRDGEKLAKSYEIPFFETSSLQNINLDEAFTCAATAVLRSPVWSRGLSVSQDSANRLVKQKTSWSCC
eukprot:gene13098-14368_t